MTNEKSQMENGKWKKTKPPDSSILPQLVLITCLLPPAPASSSSSTYPRFFAGFGV
jgi:hypothetical protein